MSYCGMPTSQIEYVIEQCPRCDKGWKRCYTVGAYWRSYCDRCREIIIKLEKYERELEAQSSNGNSTVRGIDWARCSWR